MHVSNRKIILLIRESIRVSLKEIYKGGISLTGIKAIGGGGRADTDSSDDEYDREYSYPVNRPLKYSDVFTFQ